MTNEIPGSGDCWNLTSFISLCEKLFWSVWRHVTISRKYLRFRFSYLTTWPYLVVWDVSSVSGCSFNRWTPPNIFAARYWNIRLYSAPRTSMNSLVNNKQTSKKIIYFCRYAKNGRKLNFWRVIFTLRLLGGELLLLIAPGPVNACEKHHSPVWCKITSDIYNVSWLLLSCLFFLLWYYCTIENCYFTFFGRKYQQLFLTL